MCEVEGLVRQHGRDDDALDETVLRVVEEEGAEVGGLVLERVLGGAVLALHDLLGVLLALLGTLEEGEKIAEEETVFVKGVR